LTCAAQRSNAARHQLAFVVDAGDAAAQPTGVVDCHLDHIGLDAEIGEPGDESSPQIVQSPRRRISHGGVEPVLGHRPAADRRFTLIVNT
jgi:hypothetical protein